MMEFTTRSVACSVTRQEFELDCVREFSHSGLHLGPHVTSAERRERIRLAISREHKGLQRWRGTSHTYADVFKSAYNLPLGETNDVKHVASPTFRHSDAGELWRRAGDMSKDVEDEDEEFV